MLLPPTTPTADLAILISEGPPVLARFDVLQQYSSCVEGLPPNSHQTCSSSTAPQTAYTLDLRGLVLQGEDRPVGQSTVNQWLGLIGNLHHHHVEVVRGKERATSEGGHQAGHHRRHDGSLAPVTMMTAALPCGPGSAQPSCAAAAACPAKATAARHRLDPDMRRLLLLCDALGTCQGALDGLAQRMANGASLVLVPCAAAASGAEGCDRSVPAVAASSPPTAAPASAAAVYGTGFGGAGPAMAGPSYAGSHTGAAGAAPFAAAATWEWELIGQTYFFDASGYLCRYDAKENVARTVIAREDSWRTAACPALCTALEEWLYLAGRLRLLPLLRVLLGVVQDQATLLPRRSVLRTTPEGGGMAQSCDAVASIFSARVLQHLPRQLLLEGFLCRTLMYDDECVRRARALPDRISRSARQAFVGGSALQNGPLISELIDRVAAQGVARTSGGVPNAWA